MTFKLRFIIRSLKYLPKGNPFVASKFTQHENFILLLRQSAEINMSVIVSNLGINMIDRVKPLLQASSFFILFQFVLMPGCSG